MQAIPMYILKDFMNEPKKGNLYEPELQKVEKDENALWFIEKKLRKITLLNRQIVSVE